MKAKKNMHEMKIRLTADEASKVEYLRLKNNCTKAEILRRGLAQLTGDSFQAEGDVEEPQQSEPAPHVDRPPLHDDVYGFLVSVRQGAPQTVILTDPPSTDENDAEACRQWMEKLGMYAVKPVNIIRMRFDPTSNHIGPRPSSAPSRKTRRPVAEPTEIGGAKAKEPKNHQTKAKRPSNIKREVKPCKNKSAGCSFTHDWPASLAKHERECKAGSTEAKKNGHEKGDSEPSASAGKAGRLKPIDRDVLGRVAWFDKPATKRALALSLVRPAKLINESVERLVNKGLLQPIASTEGDGGFAYKITNRGKKALSKKVTA